MFSGHLLRSPCLQMPEVHQRKQYQESKDILQVASDHAEVSETRKGCGEEAGVLEAMAETQTGP